MLQIKSVEARRTFHRLIIYTPSTEQSTDRVPGFVASAVGLYSLRAVWRHNDADMWQDRNKFHTALRVITGLMCLSWGGYWLAAAIWEWLNTAVLLVCLAGDGFYPRYLMLT